MARVDLPSALALANDCATVDPDSNISVLNNIALRVAADNPAAAEQVLRLIPHATGRRWLPPAIVWKMATTDPARRLSSLVEEEERSFNDPRMYLFLALGLKSHDPAAANRAFQAAMQGIDRFMKQGARAAATQWEQWVLLPLVEQIDPGLVPEVFWRAIATRPATGNPRSDRESCAREVGSSSGLVRSRGGRSIV